MRAEYVSPAEPGSRLSSTRGSPANLGETDLDTGSDGAVATAACLDAGTLALGRAVSAERERRVGPGAVDALGDTLLSGGGAPASRIESTVAASREGAGSGDEAGPRSGRSAWGASVVGARVGPSAGAGLSVTTGPRT